MVPGILKKGISRILRKNPTVKKVLRFVDTDKLVDDAARYIAKGAHYIKRNWKTPYGKSLLIEQRGRMRMRSGPLIIAPGNKRVYPGSRGTAKRLKRASSATRTARTSKAIDRRGAGHFARAGYRRTIRPRKGRLQTMVSRLLKKSLMYQNGMFVWRQISSNQISWQEQNRYVGSFRLYNYYFDSATNFADFGCPPGSTASATGGFLERMPVQRQNATTLPATQDNMNASVAGLNRWTKGSDMENKVAMMPARMLCHFRNNTPFTVELNIYTFRALKDIRAASGSDGATSLYSPDVLWTEYLEGTGYVAAANMAGVSNLTTGASVIANPLTRPSDARPAFYGYWKKVSFTKCVMAPGDEIKHHCKQKARVLSMDNFKSRMIEHSTDGCYAMKGDLVMMVIARGGICHEDGDPSATTFAGLSGAYVDMVHWVEFKGVMLPQASIRYYNYQNNLPTIVAGTSNQWGASVSNQT